MKIIILFIAFGLIGLASFCQTKGSFNLWFVNETMRLDLNHFSSIAEEHFSIQSIRKEGTWSGNQNNLFETLNLGDYYFVVTDVKTNLPLFSSGFSSGFENDENWTVTNDCIRFPFPNEPIQISIKKRNKNNIGFHEIFNQVIDPSNPSINQFSPISNAITNVIFENGKPSEKVDIVILGDGYNDLEKTSFFRLIIKDKMKRVVAITIKIQPDLKILNSFFGIHNASSFNRMVLVSAKSPL